ncbi:MAG: GTPase HflX, partial [Bifidobacteriales bacterium]|nr:GTPase HflX [Bifidobacteriales bacterium]
MQEHGSAVVGARQDPLLHKSEVLTRGEGQVGQDQDQEWEERSRRNAFRHVEGLGELQDVTEVEYRKVRL